SPGESGIRALVAAPRLEEQRAHAGIEGLQQVSLPDVARKIARRGVVPARVTHAQTLRREPQLFELEVLRRIRILAVRAEDSHQALRQNADHARSQEE